jgi:hypothetical protein
LLWIIDKIKLNGVFQNLSLEIKEKRNLPRMREIENIKPPKKNFEEDELRLSKITKMLKRMKYMLEFKLKRMRPIQIKMLQRIKETSKIISELNLQLKMDIKIFLLSRYFSSHIPVNSK